jgi:hypothetical protein
VREWLLAVVAIAGAIVLGWVVARAVRGQARLGSEGDIATYRTLHLASLAAPSLRWRGTAPGSGTAPSPCSTPSRRWSRGRPWW